MLVQDHVLRLNPPIPKIPCGIPIWFRNHENRDYVKRTVARWHHHRVAQTRSHPRIKSWNDQHRRHTEGNQPLLMRWHLRLALRGPNMLPLLLPVAHLYCCDNSFDCLVVTMNHLKTWRLILFGIEHFYVLSILINIQMCVILKGCCKTDHLIEKKVQLCRHSIILRNYRMINL